ncbi:MAG TPA: transporter substrate-binding domain-containing protein [Xanthobacteraceae bacterium]|nr:transporter substrate-binding domain-containing protein [Xanthobacteraceae bacterium]
MRPGLAAALASAVFIAIACGAVSPRAEESGAGPLRVCLAEDLPPYSVRHGATGGGFDFLIAEALAKRLGRPLAVQWFESKLDEDSSSAIEANALLSDGRCDLLGGYPLTRDALAKPGFETARMPDFDGAKAADRRRRVTLGTLAPTTPYHFAAFTIVLGGKAAERRIAGIGDLDGLPLGIEAGTLGDAILMSFDHGRLISQITHMVPGRGELLPRLERGDYDATFVALHHFDAYRNDHPDTKLKPTGYYFPLGFNMGFVGLTSEAGLIERVDAALGEMLKDGEPAALAEAAHMTYLPPRQPYILEGISMSDLAK